MTGSGFWPYHSRYWHLRYRSTYGTPYDKCPAEWNKWPEDFGLPSSRNTGIRAKTTREALVTEIALATSNNLRSASTYGQKTPQAEVPG